MGAAAFGARDPDDEVDLDFGVGAADEAEEDDELDFGLHARAARVWLLSCLTLRCPPPGWRQVG